MTNVMRIAVAVVAVVVIAILGINLLPRTGFGGPSATATPSPSHSDAASVRPSTAPAGLPPAGPLAIGRHPMILAGVPLSLELSTTGWTSVGDFFLDKGNVTAGDYASMLLWPNSAPDNTYSDPCTRTELDPPAGPSIADRAAAVAAVPGIELVSGPTEVTVGGHPAQRVVITIPSTIGCAANSFYLWYDAQDPIGGRRYATAGSTIYTWIIDVDGTVLWVEGETLTAGGPERAQEIQEIVDSIQFE